MVYYGKPSCENNYENYIEIVKYVFRSYKRECPLIINTMGWVAGNVLHEAQGATTSLSSTWVWVPWDA